MEPDIDAIRIRGARLHNLRNVTVDIPRNRLVVLTGLSGSGKSSLAFDTLHREGQRQYLESLGMVTAFVSKPAVDSITGLSPSISVDQHLTNHSPRSTVGTVTDVFTYLRLLWARAGHRPCPACGTRIPPGHEMDGVGTADGDETERGPALPCPHCGEPVPGTVMGDFSFNKPEGACPTCTGLGVAFHADPHRLVDHERSVAGGAVLGWQPVLTERNVPVLHAAARHYGLTFDADVPVQALPQPQRDLLLHGVQSPQFHRHLPAAEAPAPPAKVAEGRFEGVITSLLRRYAERIEDTEYRQRTERQYLVQRTCPDCDGTRLRPESRAFTVAGLTLVEAARLSLDELADWLGTLREQLDAGNTGNTGNTGNAGNAGNTGNAGNAGNTGNTEEWAVVEPVVDDLCERVRRLVDVGVGYLTPEQATPSLSAGETQRLRLAALLGSGLTGVLYVLDEPTIGLHAADTDRLIGVLRRLRDLGNTVLVVEHSLDVLRAADHLIDFGPGAGRDGGHVVAQGTPDQVAAAEGSPTGDHLAGRLPMPVPRTQASASGTGPHLGPGAGDGGPALVVRGARAHNLKNVTVRLPLERLVTVTGPSGSGKSTLLLDTVDRAARQHFHGAGDAPGAHDGIDGWEHLDKVVTIDQRPISRLARSNAATYSDALAPIREAFAATEEARQRGLGPGHFSFNVTGGRCERCSGSGVLTVTMHFLPGVEVRCPGCQGRRFQREVLEVRYGGHDIAEILELPVDDALTVFAGLPRTEARLRRMADVGLGYLRLGQPATTLSGGEAQRVKLAKELGQRATGRTLYLLDEPTTGLHAADTARLLGVLRRLVDAGNTVVTIEHDLDVARASDWILDLGPAGGAAGGRVLAEGTPGEVARANSSPTGAFLR